MMLDRHDAHENLPQKVRNTRDAAVSADRPVADREVPLPEVAAADTTIGAVNMWLDGEASEADAREADDKAVRFWARVAKDTETMRQVKAPSRLTADIMAALPGTAPLAD